MKKFTLILLIISSMVMCGCQNDQSNIPSDTSSADVTTTTPDTATPQTTPSPETTEPTPETTEPVTTVSEDELYRDIVCQTSEKYLNTLFSYKNSI